MRSTVHVDAVLLFASIGESALHVMSCSHWEQFESVGQQHVSLLCFVVRARVKHAFQIIWMIINRLGDQSSPRDRSIQLTMKKILNTEPQVNS